jgi:hypothetical protein
MKQLLNAIKNFVIPPHAQALRLSSGFYPCFIIKAALDLGFLEALSHKCMDSQELSTELRSGINNINKLSQALVSIGMLRENKDLKYSLTKLGQAFLPGSYPNTVGPLVKYILGDMQVRSMMELSYSIQTNQPSFNKISGIGFYDYGKQNPEFLDTMDSAMEIYAGMSLPEIIKAYRFSQYNKIVDIAGGLGQNLAGILLANPKVSGVLFDQPATIDRAKKYLSSFQILDRCTLVAGDMFKEIPKGGNLYILSKTLNDWDDKHALMILKQIREAMSPDSKLILIEMIGKGKSTIQQIYRDFGLLTMCGGKVRSIDNINRFLEESGFELERVIPTKGPFTIAGFIKKLGAFSIIEANPV